jgi:putative membrane protein
VERPERVRVTKANSCIIIIILFHVVGLAGFFTPALLPLFLKIVPFHILLMLAVIIYSHNRCDGKFIAFIIATFSLGFAVEWVGVHKHIIFGNYAYGHTLGFKLWDIPLTIGVNWFLVVYAVGVLMQRSGLKSAVTRVALGTIILTLLDFVIEPVAIKYHYWHWQPHSGPFAAPLSNYAGWLGVGILMLLIFELMKFKKQSVVAVVLLVTQLVFFSVLHLV